MTVETMTSNEVSRNFGSIVNRVLGGLTVIVTRYTDTLAVVMSHKEYERLKRIEAEVEDLRLIAESRRISIENTMNDTWVSGEEMDRMMVERGVFTAEELGIEGRLMRKFENWRLRLLNDSVAN